MTKKEKVKAKAKNKGGSKPTGNPNGRPKKGEVREGKHRNKQQMDDMNKKLWYIRQQAALMDLKSWFKKPEQKDRIISLSEMAMSLKRKALWLRKNAGMANIGQLYLEIYPDCSNSTRVYYEALIVREKERASNLTFNLTVGDKTVTKHVDITTAQAKARALDNLITTKVGSHSVTSDLVVRDPSILSERDQKIAKVRDRFISAPISDSPTIDGVMREFGIIDKAGNPLMGITESDVRKVALEEDWKSERKSSIHRRWDYIDDEIKMVTTVRNLEAQKMIFQAMKLHSRAVTQYYTTGQVTSVEKDPTTGKTRTLAMVPDVGALAGLAEVMRRMTDGNKDINIQINQFGNMDQSNSLFIKQYANQLSSLSPEQLNDEINRIKQIRSVLDDGFQDAMMAEIIDAEILP